MSCAYCARWGLPDCVACCEREPGPPAHPGMVADDQGSDQAQSDAAKRLKDFRKMSSAEYQKMMDRALASWRGLKPCGCPIGPCRYSCLV